VGSDIWHISIAEKDWKLVFKLVVLTGSQHTIGGEFWSGFVGACGVDAAKNSKAGRWALTSQVCMGPREQLTMPSTYLRQAGLVRLLLLGLLLGLVSGCSTLGYYQQAISGQLQLLAKRRPLAEVLADPAVAVAVKDKIRLAQAITSFAADELGLPVDDSYTSYVDVGTPYLVWNVFAAPEFDLTLLTYCYPIAGCVSYKGYFDATQALAFEQSLGAKGYDTFAGGVAAYSTLGWFADPLLSTFISREDTQLAALLFHELAHKVVYVRDDTRFNESFATAVEHIALRRWLQARQQGDVYAAYLVTAQRRSEVLALIAEARDELQRLYASDLGEDAKRRQKALVIAGLQERYRLLASHWEGAKPFNAWMQGDINNARLGAVADYNDWTTSFERWLDELQGDLPSFFAAVQQLAAMPPVQRDKILKSYAP
jgi:predicted aminopeptidase